MYHLSQGRVYIFKTKSKNNISVITPTSRTCRINWVLELEVGDVPIPTRNILTFRHILERVQKATSSRHGCACRPTPSMFVRRRRPTPACSNTYRTHPAVLKHLIHSFILSLNNNQFLSLIEVHRCLSNRSIIICSI